MSWCQLKGRCGKMVTRGNIPWLLSPDPKRKQNNYHFFYYSVNSDWYNAFLQGYDFTHGAKKTQGVGIIQASRYPQISGILGILPKTNQQKNPAKLVAGSRSGYFFWGFWPPVNSTLRMAKPGHSWLTMQNGRSVLDIPWSHSRIICGSWLVRIVLLVPWRNHGEHWSAQHQNDEMK